MCVCVFSRGPGWRGHIRGKRDGREEIALNKENEESLEVVLTLVVFSSLSVIGVVTTV